MKQIKTTSGFEIEIDESQLDDLEFLDLVCDLDDNVNPRAYRKIVRKMLGEDESRLYDHIRTDDGRVPVSALTREILEILNGCGAKK